MALAGRNIFIWQLKKIVDFEISITDFVEKAKAARLSGIFIKIADGAHAYNPNMGPIGTDQEGVLFKAVTEALTLAGIKVWGWCVTVCETNDDAKAEAKIVCDLAIKYKLSGIIFDIEEGDEYFAGEIEQAETYLNEIKTRLTGTTIEQAVCGHDIITRSPEYLALFKRFASFVAYSIPQVYYGGSASVERRLSDAITANQVIQLPFMPAGAGWVGPNGGFSDWEKCADWTLDFLTLVTAKGFTAYSFWVWMDKDGQEKFWEVLNSTPVFPTHQLEGGWASDDTSVGHNRWLVTIHGTSCIWTEYKNGGLTLEKIVPIKKVGQNFRIERPNTKDVLLFLGAAESMADQIVARNPGPSSFVLDRSGDKITGTWSGLAWTLKADGTLDTLLYKTKVFNLIVEPTP